MKVSSPVTGVGVPTPATVPREHIERQCPPNERATLMTITSILAGMRYTDVEQWFEFFGGSNMLAESPLYQKWMRENSCKTKQDDIVRILQKRFGAVPEASAAQVRTVTDLEKLDRAIDDAIECRTLEAFRNRLTRL